MVTAFVAAKGHSARVPRKNLRDFSGAPLFHRILQTLSDATQVDQILLDSDNDEILESAALRFPEIDLIRRPNHLVGDEIPMNALIAHAFGVADCDVMLQTHATNPLLKASTVDAAIHAFSQSNCSSLMSVTAIQTRLYWEDLRAINHDPAQLIPTQDLPKVYEENSNIYIFTRRGFTDAGHRVTESVMPFEMDALEAVDIDNESDFQLALALDGQLDRSSH